MKKFIFLAGLALGFVLGSRMGRGPYESLERTARQVADDPEVQRRATQARETAGKVAHDAADTVKEKGPEAASSVQGAVSGAAAAAKGRLSSDDSDDGGTATADLDAESSKLTAQSEETANAAGDGEVGEDEPLSSS